TATAEFFRQVKTLLLTLGYPTSTKHDISGWGQSPLYVLRLRNQSYNAKFRDEIGFIGLRKHHAVLVSDHTQVGRHDHIYLSAELLSRVQASGVCAQSVAMSTKRGRGVTRRSLQEIYTATGDEEMGRALEFFYD